MRTLNLMLASFMVFCLTSGQVKASTVDGADGEEILQNSALIRAKLESVIDNKPVEDTEDAEEEKTASVNDENLLPGQRFLKRYHASVGRQKIETKNKTVSSAGDERQLLNRNIKERIAEIVSEPETPEFVVDESLSAEEKVSIYCQYLDYQSGTTNTIFLKPRHKTDIILPAGEKLERISIGDDQRFIVSPFFDKSNDQWHVYISPVQYDIVTNIIISTDGYTFQAVLETSDLFKPFVRWNVPDSIKNRGDRYELQLGVDDVRALYFGYTKSGETGEFWAPQTIFDDRFRNTYVVFEKDVLRRINPMVFAMTEGEKKILVPYRKRGDTLIISKVYDSLEICINGRFIKLNRMENTNGERFNKSF